MNVKSGIAEIQGHISKYNCRLVAVSKTYPIEAIMEAYEAGQRDFGENKVQEMVPKFEALPKDIRWHMIGHLQSNKVKYIAHFVHLIHSVDSFKLLSEINKEAVKNNRVISCLLQMHIAEEETKYGFDESELFSLLDSPEFNKLNNIKVVGLMGMATFTDDKEKIKAEFSSIKSTFDVLKSKYPSDSKISMLELSIGMSNDFLIACEQGSTMVRIGTSIFGKRDYK
ncbi:MAG: YggS family pyridoxal phosphate-dependent enzyme [Cytophagaceae bacterium]